MKIDEFTEETEKLERFYGKEIPEEQKKIWYKEFKNTSIERYKYIIGIVYRTMKFLPKLADLIEINTNSGYTQAKNETTIKDCKECNSTGYVLYKKEIDGIKYEFAAICKCRQQPQYVGWKIADEKHRSEYYIPYIEQI